MNGFRGTRRIKLEVLASEILKIAILIETKNKSFSDIEINPLFVYETSTCAVDAIIGTSNQL